MPIRVALHHETRYVYDRLVQLGPQTIRLRPAPHCRTPVASYSLRVEPALHFLNWQQDPHGNFLARLVFPEPAREFRVSVDLVAEMTVINPFDFFVEESAEHFPFAYEPELAADLRPYLERLPATPLFEDYIRTIDQSPRKTVAFLVDLNAKLQSDIRYLIRMAPGVQSPDETLRLRSGSCRDSAWLAVQLLRRLGIAARFVSGYLIQLTPDEKPLEGPAGAAADFTDLHAWAEAFVPGAGWIGIDPTSALLTGEGHLPLAATPSPQTAAPISGAVDEADVEFTFSMKVTRVHEDPRVTKPYTDEQWGRITNLGRKVDDVIQLEDIRLTMGGEPTFVSIDDMEAPEWNTTAVGRHKQQLSDVLIRRLRDRFAPGGLLHFGQGKWYPGESLPRWAYSCLWRKDGQPLWSNPALLANPAAQGAASAETAEKYLRTLARGLGVSPRWMTPAYEDVWRMLDVEQKLPIDLDPRDCALDSSEDRRRLARVIESGGLRGPSGYVLPLTRAWWQARAGWVSGPWPVRSSRLFLIPGDSPLGLRLPLGSLPRSAAAGAVVYSPDPFDRRPALPGYAEIRRTTQLPHMGELHPAEIVGQQRRFAAAASQTSPQEAPAPDAADAPEAESTPFVNANVIATALCVEPRNGVLHVFLPPVGRLEDFLELVSAAEEAAERAQTPVVIEGYLPPHDPRLNVLKVTPDPGVIEVNVHPAHDWRELEQLTTGLYDEARRSRLGTEKFQLDGRHSGTGGGNHIVLGGPTPGDSPFLRRPDLLQSLITYWNNHPALSYLFSGLFIGPTSQAPRVDEGRRDALDELELAFQQIPEFGGCPPWIVDRAFRNLLIDLTGNTHRAEICIDKLYAPEHAAGRLGLVELRGFEMPPHARMSLTQQLLVRALVARFWKQPYRERLIHWGPAIHDRWLLPEFLQQDLDAVLADLRAFGFEFDSAWFAPHVEFRLPRIGELQCAGVSLELRQAIEPWYVLGEEPGGGGTTRYVDSSVERLQIKVQGRHADRLAIACNGIEAPLQSTGAPGEYVCGVRYRAWQPPSCLHPLIPVHTPLVFDVVDRQAGRSLGGCRYHVDHPGGLNPAVYPINALEAESRRAARFSTLGHTPGPLAFRTAALRPKAPCTLDLRRV